MATRIIEGFIWLALAIGCLVALKAVHIMMVFTSVVLIIAIIVCILFAIESFVAAWQER